MNSLQDLNNYSNDLIAYQDARNPVIFEIDVAENQSVEFDENDIHLLPISLVILEINEPARTQLTVEINLAALSGPNSSSVDINLIPVPENISIVEVSNNVFQIRGFNGLAQWNAIKDNIIVQVPFGFNGAGAYTARVIYLDDDLLPVSISWIVSVNVIPQQKLSVPELFRYYVNTTEIIPTATILLNTGSFEPIWTMTITPSNSSALTNVTTSVANVLTYNPLTGVTVITGNKTEVNAALNNLSVTFGNFSENFVFSYLLSNNINSQQSLQTQTARSQDFIVLKAFDAELQSDSIVIYSSTVDLETNISMVTDSNVIYGAESELLVDAEFSYVSSTFAMNIDTNLMTNNTFVMSLVNMQGVIDWGDGEVEVFDTLTTKPQHEYAVKGTYNVIFNGTASEYSIFVNTVDEESDARKAITRIVELGDVIERFRFTQALNLVRVPSQLPAQIKSIKFPGCSLFDQPLNQWDVSNIDDMSSMFGGTAFNRPINGWNVSNVTNMSFMFSGPNTAFNQPIDGWDVSNVTNMSDMFRSNSVFDQPINTWDVSNVTNMSGMFRSNSIFNRSIDAWDVSSVTNMSYMFASSVYNQPLTNWNVISVTDMSYMFQLNTAFNQSIDSWNVSNVTNMSFMFERASAFNRTLNNWDVSSVTNMNFMFSQASLFNGTLNNWDVSNVTNMSFMFDRATAFNQPINSWDVSKLTINQMSTMFRSASSYNQNLSSWCVPLILTKPTDFDNSATAWSTSNKPVWGTCPITFPILSRPITINTVGNVTSVFSGNTFFANFPASGINNYLLTDKIGRMSGNWTIEGFVDHRNFNLSANSRTPSIVQNFNYNGLTQGYGAFEVFIEANSQGGQLLKFRIWNSDNTTLTITSNQFISNARHFALVRNNGTISMFLNGALQTQTINTSVLVNHLERERLLIGSSNANLSTGNINALIKDIKVSITPRYTTTFSPPTFLENDADTRILLKPDLAAGNTTFKDEIN